MWVAIAMVIIALLLVATAPKPQVENARPAKLGDFQVPRSKYGDPSPLFWGTIRQKSPLVGWYGDFRPVPIKKKIKSGFGSSKKVITGYKNYLGMDLILSLGTGLAGTGIRLRKLWAGTYEIWSGNVTGVTDIVIDKPNLFGGEDQRGGMKGTITFYDGRFDPPRDSYLASVLDPNVPAYNGICRIVMKSFYIGTTTSLELLSAEIQNLKNDFGAYGVMPNGYDVNPMQIAYDVFTNRHGRFGALPEEMNMASFTAAAQTLYNEGLGMSLLVQSTISGRDLMEEVMRVADGFMYQDPDNTQVYVTLIRNDYDIATLPVIEESDIIDIKNFSKTTWANTFNQCRVTFNDRAFNYDESVAATQDFANITFQQRVRPTTISAPGVADSTVANILAAKQLSILSVPIYKCDLTLNRRKANSFRPGTVFKLNYGPYGLTNMVMRVSKINLGELTSNKIKISCVQDKFATSTPVFAKPPVSSWTPITTTPGEVIVRNAFTPPFFFARQDGEAVNVLDNLSRVMMLAKGPTGASLAFDLWTSLSTMPTAQADATLAMADIPYAIRGTLQASYASTVAFDTGNDSGGTLRVTGLTAADIEVITKPTSFAIDGSAMFMINDELFSYSTVTTNVDGSISFGTVNRALLDTTFGSHTTGDAVWFFSGQESVPAISQTLGTNNYKLLDITSSAKRPYEDAASVAVNLTNRASLPAHPTFVRINGERVPASSPAAASCSLTWLIRSRITQSLSRFNDVSETAEPGTITRLRWRFGAGAWTSVDIPNGTSNYTIPTASVVGTLTVEIWTVLTDATGRPGMSNAQSRITTTIQKVFT